MKTLVFLDIDGVLNTSGKLYEPVKISELSEPRSEEFLKTCMKLIEPDQMEILNKFLQKISEYYTDESGPQIVIHSNWKHDMTVFDIDTIFRAAGYTGPDIRLCTPSKIKKTDSGLFTTVSKSESIISFLQMWTHQTGKVDRIFIVDDEKIFDDTNHKILSDYAKFPVTFVQPNPDSGLKGLTHLLIKFAFDSKILYICTH